MPNVITDAVVHKLIKESGQRVANLELRPEVLQINNHVQHLIDLIYKQYSEQVGKGFGKFEADANEYPVQSHLLAHLAPDGTSFLEMSADLMRHLQTRSSAEQFSTGGFVLIAKITSDGNQYLLCAIVTEVAGVAITEGLDVIQSQYLDMSHMRVAGRIDLTQWQAGGDRYISFLKGRTDVSGYFRLFLGCNDIHIPLAESKKLVTALEAFADQAELGAEQRDHLFELAHGYLSNLSRSKQPVELEAFSNHVWPIAPQALRTVMSEPSHAISDGFVPDQRALKALVKFEGKAQYWKLTFDRKALRNREILFNREAGTLTLSNLPPSLRDELERDSQPDETDQI
ncbi:MAG: nucleoid-associated protein [Limnohabitans sp.]|nr:nucleoid-associated protein [Limnohabitans sp.]